MIKIIDNFLDGIQCKSIINLSNSLDTKLESDYTYTSYNQYLKRVSEEHIDENIKNKLEKIVPEFSKCEFKYLRLQFIDESIIQSKIFHKHINPFSFIIYLNDDFIGGELEFENENIIIPKKGMMVYFSDEKHRVYNCVGKRWCLVGFLNNDMFSKKQKTII